MEIEIKAKALKNITAIAKHIEGINTPDAGSRWLDRFMVRISAYAKPNVSYPICHNKKLASRKFSCIVFSKWVVAFKIVRDHFVICEVIFGPTLGT